MAKQTTYLSYRPQRRRGVEGALQAAMTVFKAVEELVTLFDGFVNKWQTGTATMLTGTSAITVNHDFGSANYRPYVTPTGDTGAVRWWVANITANSFQIMASANLAASTSFNWLLKGA